MLYYLDARILSLYLKKIKRNYLSPRIWNLNEIVFPTLCHLIENEIWEVKLPKTKEILKLKNCLRDLLRFCCLKSYKNTNKNGRMSVIILSFKNKNYFLVSLSSKDNNQRYLYYLAEFKNFHLGNQCQVLQQQLFSLY